ncbi:MAG: hypothetical protein R3C16_01435 [Hyphomonadaceae bacterium]
MALNLDERERLVRGHRRRKLMLLRNHGTLAVGQTAADAFLGIFFLEARLRATSGRVERRTRPSADRAGRGARKPRAQSGGLGMVSGLAWPGLKRKLDRHLPGYGPKPDQHGLCRRTRSLDRA